MTLFEVVMSKIKLWQKIYRSRWVSESFSERLKSTIKDWINVLSGPKLPHPPPFLFLHTHLIADHKWEMSLLKIDTLFKLINN